VYDLTDVPDSTTDALRITVNGLLQSVRSTHNLTTTFGYDALGRLVAVLDSRGGLHSRGFDAAGRVAWSSDPATNGTWYAYDSANRVIAVTNSLGLVTQTAYDLQGREIAAWGATYPVAYQYNDYGQMTGLYTYRGSQNIATSSDIAGLISASAMDRTTWRYDDTTGLLTNKVYADGKGTSYS
jgi:YD repeat-containing protein